MLLLVEHLQHAVGDAEAAEHIDRGEDDGGAADDLRRSTHTWCHHRVEQGIAGGRDGADDGDPREGVHARHERGMQQAGHILDDEIAHHCAYHEHNNQYDW